MGQDSYLPLKKSGQSVIDQNLPYRFLRESLLTSSTFFSASQLFRQSSTSGRSPVRNPRWPALTFFLDILYLNPARRTRCCGILLTPLRRFKQIKRTVSFDVSTRLNAIQQSTAMYNSHIFNGRNTTINVTKRSTINESPINKFII